MRTIDIQFQKYFTREYRKTQIYIHHTVSPNKLHGRGIQGDLSHWNNQSFNIGTYCIIDSDGTIYQLFNSNKWSNHLGLKKSTFEKNNIPYQKLDKTSIGIELDNLGPLIWTKKGYTSYAYPHSFYVPEDRVIDYGEKGFRGHRYYEAYTEEQIESLRLLLSSLTDDYAIPKHYNEDMWEVSQNALKGVSGIWTHTSVRRDKQDLHPQPNLIKMLKELKHKPIEPIPEGKPLVFTEKDKQIKELENTLSQIGWRKNINNGID
jgi:predicted GNAT family acetyltransferase